MEWQRLADIARILDSHSLFAQAVTLRHAACPATAGSWAMRVNPLEAGLIGSVDFAKGCPSGRRVSPGWILTKRCSGTWCGCRFSAGAVVSEGAVLEQEGRNLGQVTSLSVTSNHRRTAGVGLHPWVRLSPEPN